MTARGRLSARIAGSALLAVAALFTAGCGGDVPPRPRFDVVLRGGTVIDGTGAAPRRADVAVRDGRIVEVGDLGPFRADETIGVTGQVVAPGFVDMHSHADLILLAPLSDQYRLLEAKIRQGVTTLIVGNCGLGVAPSDAGSAPILAAVNGWMTPDGVEAGPLDTAGFLERMERDGVVLNVGTLLPHGPLRFSVMGPVSGPPAPAQIDAMRQGLARGLASGAFGMSVGLIYPPGMYSPTSELIELARVVAAINGLFTAHVRGSSETLIQATHELIEIARNSGARVHHSHLEAVGEPFWPRIGEVLALEDRARDEALAISHDVFPYTRAATMMAAIFPPWSLEGGVPKLLERLADPETRQRIRHEVQTRVPEWPPWQPGGWPHNLVEAVGWDGILIAAVDGPDEAHRVGKDLQRLAREEQREPFDIVADLMIAERGRVGQFVAEISGAPGRIEPLLQILDHPAAAIVSDAEDYGRGAPHPAHAGAFARALRINREHDLMPLETIVRKMTGYPATLIGLDRRGTIQAGHHADLVVFDPAAVTDRADWSEPRRAAQGVSWVLINGQVALREGRFVEEAHGTVLRAP